MLKIKLLKIFILTIALSFCFTQNSFSQEAWSLQQCIEHALENNIQLKQQELSVNLSKNRVTRATFNAVPNLNASVSHGYNFGQTINLRDNIAISGDSESTSFSINSQVILFNGLQIPNIKRQEKVNLMAALTDLEKVRNNISLNIVAAYLQVIFSQDLLESSINQVKLSQLQVERTQQLVNAGSLPEGNLLEVIAQQSTDELQLVNTQNQLNMAILTLTQILDLPSPEGFSVQKPNLDNFDQTVILFSPDDIYAEAEQNLPQIKSANFRVRSAELAVKVAKGVYSPTLSVSAGYNSGANRFLGPNAPPTLSFEDQIKDNSRRTVGLNLQIPIFNRMQIRTGVSDSYIQLANANYNLLLEKNALFKEIQQAHADAMAAINKFKSTEKNVVALTEAFRYTEQRFNLGLINSLDYSTSRTRLSRAETDLLSAKYDYIFKSKILDFYRGVPLSL
jgi:outer membrane protein